MASPFAGFRTTDDGTIAVQIVPDGPFVGLFTVEGVDAATLARATDDDFVLALPELLNIAGVRANSNPFKEGEKIQVELEELKSHEIEDKVLICTATNFAAAKASAAARPLADRKQPTNEDDDEEYANGAGEATDDERKAQAQKAQEAAGKRMVVAMTAEALNSVMKMASRAGLSREHIERCFVEAGGALPTQSDRDDFENDDGEEAEGAGPQPGGQQCQQQ